MLCGPRRTRLAKRCNPSQTPLPERRMRSRTPFSRWPRRRSRPRGWCGTRRSQSFVPPSPRRWKERGTRSRKPARRFAGRRKPDETGSAIQTVFYTGRPSGFVRRVLGSLVWALLAMSMAVLPFMAGSALATSPRPLASPAGALLVTFNIQVDPGSADYVHRAAQAAIASNQDLVIVMDTPGGLLENMKQIVTSIHDVQNHSLAVYTYVPPVAFAASAGSYIALATNAIYMSSGSIIGPSTPFVVGGDPSEQQHVQNAMVAYIRSLAEKNGYNVTAAVDMAQNNTAFSARPAVSAGPGNGRPGTPGALLTRRGPRHPTQTPVH